MSDTTTLTGLLPVLGSTFLAGALTQLTRQLSRAAPLGARRVGALTAAAGIAALTVAALLTVLLRPAPTPALLLAAACVTGWSGPGILTRLGGVIERQLGVPGPPEAERNEAHRTHPVHPDGHTEA
ncbi:hypothetical protein [Deinococcus sp. YIM 77859]|uniref:hypothetical protein n=1 Tax=Deinococcus sp. YIM 77859 TaxID=1540221 RepID=UPI00054ECE32|nr:hypothetical protein [Deinococcus sp. YIM 77859]